MMNSNNQYVKQVETRRWKEFILENKRGIHTCIRRCGESCFSSPISTVGVEI